MSRLTVGTWNMGHWQYKGRRSEAWKYLRSEAAVDVILLQESAIAEDVPKSSYHHRRIEGRRDWGSGVLAFPNGAEVYGLDTVRTIYDAKRHFDVTGYTGGYMAAAYVTLPGVKPFVGVSLYAMPDLYAQTVLLRLVADLIPLFDSPKYRERIVLGGDFNINIAMRADSPQKALELGRYRAILRCVESLGLINLLETVEDGPSVNPECPCDVDNCRHVQTFSNGAQIDFLYATAELADGCSRIWVDQRVMGKGGLSDHAPVIAEFTT